LRTITTRYPDTSKICHLTGPFSSTVDKTIPNAPQASDLLMQVEQLLSTSISFTITSGQIMISSFHSNNKRTATFQIYFWYHQKATSTCCTIIHVSTVQVLQQTRVAPPVSMASISAKSSGVRRNLAGSSLRSKYSPLPASTEPSWWPVSEPIPLPLRFTLRAKGPCCWACCL